MDEVEINVEDDGDLRLLADGGNRFQKLRRSGAGFEAALGGKLVHQAVGQRVAERHAEFQHVHAGFVERQREFARGGQIRVARADIDDESLFAAAISARRTFSTMRFMLAASFRFQAKFQTIA